MVKLLTKSILALLFFTSVSESREYRFDYTYNNEIAGWWKLHRIPGTWNEARLRCHAEGAVLASPLNEHLLRVMKTIVATNSLQCGIYSGIHATLSKGVYNSVEGVPLSRIPVSWAPGEPDNYENNESCLLLIPNGTMADVNCTQVFPYICYKKKTQSVVQTTCGTTDTKYFLEPRTGSCYKFHYIGQTWHQAYMTCAAEGGHLAIINSATEAQALKELFAKYPANTIMAKYKDPALVGFLDWSKDNTWFTIHGETLDEAGYNNWPAGQPDNMKHGNQGEQCGGLFRSGYLDDVWCEHLTLPFICEKSPDSLLTEE
ncbi:macrophage mannose receptor 1-like isoform X2 [Achroia grisella]|uniref:macrophage mannose receptor 1-like isoform X2 n=1 Tax=Achroia grisella TaxID=688607 RepID=UPI0027D302B0|nr:macrophage mannose receptor 1-like isoform X2 [Achroia grisella]